MLNTEDAIILAEKAVSVHYVLSTLNFFSLKKNVHFSSKKVRSRARDAAGRALAVVHKASRTQNHIHRTTYERPRTQDHIKLGMAALKRLRQGHPLSTIFNCV